ncbi:histone lysine methyltransferase Set9 [Maublancomyces gigas]|uniref:Histone-lysine N-methyltransferase SET9 n=1 Tax=Discina gigas TaxID=1032678 RepID=A0ABR3GIH7_9PEZI
MAPPGKYQLSLSQLAEFDDLLTDALVDRVYYWTKIRKMKTSYHPNRGIKTEEVVKIIVHDVVRNKNTAGAQKKFLELNGVKQYLNKVSNKSPNAEVDFVKHARRYLSMYSPDAGFEVSSTNRYNPLCPEACVISRRAFRRGEPIKYLTGAMVRMSSAEEDAFTHGATDFSIIYSSRVGGMSLLLGPARFVNHDCEPNAKFVTTNKDNVTLLLERDIDVGEELTVKYADDYFGEGNKECLCRTCEVQMRNGWAGDGACTTEDDYEIDIDSLVPGAIITRRSSRKRVPGAVPAVETLDEVERRNRGRRKSAVSQIMSPPDSSRGMSVETGISNSISATPSVVGGADEIGNVHTPAPEEPEVERVEPATPPATNGTATPAVAAAETTKTETAVEPAAVAESLLALPGVAEEQAIKEEEVSGKQEEVIEKSRDVTIVTKVPESSPEVPRKDGPSRVGPSVKHDTPEPASDLAKSFGLSAPLSTLNVGKLSTSTDRDFDTESELSDFTEIDDADLSDTLLAPPQKLRKKPISTNSRRKKPVSQPRKKKPPTSAPSVIPALIEPPRARVPGDYLSWRLNTEGTKCVCSDCHKTFVHDDRWYVPRACKRCERHSKIYGLVWPKTVKRKNDSEEQIEDHRLVQRYVTASEHRKELRKLEEESALAESVRAKRRASYNPKDPYNSIATAATVNASIITALKTRKRKRADVDVEQEMEDIDGVFDALKSVGRGGKRSKLEAEVIR